MNRHQRRADEARQSRQQRAIARESSLSASKKKRLGIKARRNRAVVALRADPRRFEVALWLLLTEIGDMGSIEAGYLIMLLIGPLDISALAKVEDILFVLSGRRQQHGTNLEHYAERIRDKTAEAIERGTELEKVSGKRSEDLSWLIQSTTHLAIAISHPFGTAATQLSFDELAKLGWRETLGRLRSRWDAAMKSNFPPHTDKLRRSAAALLAHMKSLRSVS